MTEKQRPNIHPPGVTDPETLHRLRIEAFEATATDTVGKAVKEELDRLRATIAEMTSKGLEIAASVALIHEEIDALRREAAEMALARMGPLPDEDPIILKAQIARLRTALQMISERAVSKDIPEIESPLGNRLQRIHAIAELALDPEDT
jgi:hypothetical protein